MEASSVEFTYELTPELSRAATRRFFQHQLGWRAPVALLAYAAACGILLMTGDTLLTGIFIGAGLLLVVLAVVAYFVRTRRNAGLLAVLTDHSARCRITDDGFELHNALGNSTFAWHMVKKVVRYPDVWLLFVGPQPFWLPAGPLQGEAGRRILEHVY
ncbi:MAG TPA: YcxB family protein [Longimicrobiaceae bacterium]|nr:YcxB family protein [Longimicrobiaceae bacterium]